LEYNYSTWNKYKNMKYFFILSLLTIASCGSLRPTISDKTKDPEDNGITARRMYSPPAPSNQSVIIAPPPTLKPRAAEN
jgi:hypothetical protein